jgi:hypothetical protein
MDCQYGSVLGTLMRRTMNHLLFIPALLVVVVCNGLAQTNTAAPAAGNSSTNLYRPVEIPASWAPTRVVYICDSTNPEPAFENLPVSKWIQNKTKINTSHRSLSELLTWKPISKDNWGIARFEVPVNYQAVTSSVMGGDVELGFFDKDQNFVPCNFSGSEPASNGHAVVWWSINWDRPGRHELRARLIYYHELDSIEIIGPPLAYESDNVCQFYEGATFFNSAGTQLYAILRAPRAKFRIELTTPKGKHLKTVAGVTTTGCITNEWNLVDERGKKFQGDTFDAAFYVAYPDDTHTHAPAKVEFTRIADREP